MPNVRALNDDQIDLLKSYKGGLTLGLNIEKITAENPGSFVSHGDIFDQSDVIHLHKNLLDMAIKAGDKTAIERHTRILQKAGYKGNQK